MNTTLRGLHTLLFLAAVTGLAACDATQGLDPASDATLNTASSIAPGGLATFCADGEYNNFFELDQPLTFPDGEVLRLEGGLHATLDVAHIGNGMVSVKAHANAAGLKITDADGDTRYHVTGAENFTLEVEGDETTEVTLSFRINAPGQGQDYLLYMTVSGRRSNCGDGPFGVAVSVTGFDLVED